MFECYIMRDRLKFNFKNFCVSSLNLLHELHLLPSNSSQARIRAILNINIVVVVGPAFTGTALHDTTLFSQEKIVKSHSCEN